MKKVMFACVLLLYGCATRGELYSKLSEQNNDIKSMVRHRADAADNRIDNIIKIGIDPLERRIKILESSLLGDWDREECENYKPEAQSLFCRRQPRFAPYQASKKNRFEAASKKASEMTAAEFEKLLDAVERKAAIEKNNLEIKRCREALVRFSEIK